MKLSRLVSTVFGCGYFPKGPGTVGSLAGVLVAWLVFNDRLWVPAILILATLILFPIAVWAAGATARELADAGPTDPKAKDPQIVVIDEVIGQWIALCGIAYWSWKSVLAAFILFRLFDIWKPWPIRSLESLPGGWGIVADDIMAGIYAAIVLVPLSTHVLALVF